MTSEFDAQMSAFLTAIRAHESGGNYQAVNPHGAYGAYQFIPSTWRAWNTQLGGPQYDVASDAPPQVQDAVARLMAQSGWDRTHDWKQVAAIWYQGHPASAAELASVPAPGAGNTLTVGDYVDDVMQRMTQVAPAADTATDAAATASADPETSATQTFVHSALAMKGDEYIYGAQFNLDDPHPNAFDCSGLTRWAAHQAGHDIPAGAWAQYQYLAQNHALISVDQALHTPGAQLFYFSGPHTGTEGGPLEQHTAISLGNGKTIEAMGSAYGVLEADAAGRFNYAGIIPGMSAGTSTPIDDSASETTRLAAATATTPAADTGDPRDVDSDHDGIPDVVEKELGSDPNNPDTYGTGHLDGELPQAAVYSHGDGLSDALEAVLHPAATGTAGTASTTVAATEHFPLDNPLTGGDHTESTVADLTTSDDHAGAAADDHQLGH